MFLDSKLEKMVHLILLNSDSRSPAMFILGPMVWKKDLADK
jgi:hypothetical protein